VARLGSWREAFAWAQARGFQGTDDVGLLEAMGRRVKLIPAPASNLKITTAEDWAHACPSGMTTPG
jgi:2-C-methyl-D-erythritol 4-phosphate cytidylyltransferase